MIIEGILSIFKAIALGIINLMPPFTIQQLGSFAGLIELIANASIFVPFSTLFICLTIWVGFHVFRFWITLANWVIAKIPTIS